MFCLYVVLKVSYLRGANNRNVVITYRTDSSRPLFKQIEIFSIYTLTVWLYISIVSSFLNIRATRELLEYLLGISPSGRNPCGSNNHGDKSGWHSSLRKKKNGGGNKRRNIKLWSWTEKKCLRRFYLEKNKKNANPCASVVQLKIRVSKQTYIFSLQWYVLPLVLWNARSGEFLKLFVHKGTQQLACLVII